MKPILKVQNLSKDFIKSLDLVAKGLNRIGQNYKEEVVHAVDDVNFSIFKGEIVGVVGESCLLYTSPSPRDLSTSRMPSSA